MIVIFARTVAVAVEFVEAGDGVAIRFFQAIQRITIKRVTKRQARAEFGLQVQRRGVVMVIVGASAMAAVIIQFADGK